MILPSPLHLVVAGVAAAAIAAAGAGGWYARGVIADRAIAELQAAHSQAVALAADQAREAERDQRDEEARRTLALQKAQDDAHKRSQARAAALRAAAATGDGLRIEAGTFAAGASQAGSDSGASCSWPADGRAAVLAELLADVELLGREMARAADEARDAGRTCEAAFDSLTP